LGPVGLLVAEHGEQDVEASAGEADEGGVVAFAAGSFAVVVGAADRVGEAGERGQEQRRLERVVAALGVAFPADGAARAARDGGEPGVGGQVRRGGEGGSVADDGEDLHGGPEPDAGHRGQDRGKRVGLQAFLKVRGQAGAFGVDLTQLPGHACDDPTEVTRPGDRHRLLGPGSLPFAIRGRRCPGLPDCGEGTARFLADCCAKAGIRGALSVKVR
jgi:hypothetical protein